MPTGLAQWTLPGVSLGVAGAAGVWLDGEPIARSFVSPFDAARCLLGVADLDIAIVQIRPQDLLEGGLACARWDGALVAADAGEAVEAARRLAPNVTRDWVMTPAAATRMAGIVGQLPCEIAQDPWAALRRRLETDMTGSQPVDAAS